MVTTPSGATGLHEIEALKGWIEVVQKPGVLNPEVQDTINRMHKLISDTISIIDETLPSDSRLFIETINMFFERLDMASPPEKVLQSLFHNIMFFFLVADLSTIADISVEKLNPNLYRMNGITRHKYFKFYYICLGSSYIQSEGIKTQRMYKDTIDTIMHTELGQRYHTYILCSKHFQHAAQEFSKSGNVNIYNLENLHEQLKEIQVLDATRPMWNIRANSCKKKTSKKKPGASEQSDRRNPGDLIGIKRKLCEPSSRDHSACEDDVGEKFTRADSAHAQEGMCDTLS